MRIWDCPVEVLNRQHLLGEHVELHTMYAALLRGGGGYWNHPETQRWVGHERALYERHEALVAEMLRRGYRHKSPLPEPPSGSSSEWPTVRLHASIPPEAVEVYV